MVLRSFAFYLRAILSYLHYFLAIRRLISARTYFRLETPRTNGTKGLPELEYSIFQLPCISIFVDDVEVDAKEGGKLEIFLSPGDVVLVVGLSPTSTAFDAARRVKREKGRGRKKNRRVRNVRKHCLSGIRIFALEDM